MVEQERKEYIPIEIFYSYAHEDESFCQRFEKHLSLLRQQGMIVDWNSHKIRAGLLRQHEIDTHLNRAQIILLLISADFLTSDYSYNIEMPQALKRHRAGKARVIPILLHDVDWHNAPFSHLEMLPSTGMSVTHHSWHTCDEAFVDIAKGIRTVIEELRLQQRTEVVEASTATEFPVKLDDERPLPVRIDTIQVNNLPKSGSLSGCPTCLADKSPNLLQIPDVQEAIRQRNLVLFIGGDLPEAITGVPSRSELAHHFARLAYTVSSEIDLVDVKMWRERGIIVLNIEPADILDLLML